MNKEKALSLAAAICSKKEHCSWEIQEKLVKWEIPEKIDPDLISQVLEALDTDTYQEACLTLLKQKMKSLAGEEPYKRKAKLIRFGLSRGFDYEVIDRCLQRLPGHTDEEAENS